MLAATWLRAAAGSGGLREVSRRMLGKLGGMPPAHEATAVMSELGSGRQLGPSVRSALATVRRARKRKRPSRGERLVARMLGRGDVPMSTDEIMALTRER